MSERIVGILIILGGLAVATGGFWMQHTFDPAAKDPLTTSGFPSHHGLLCYVGKLLFVFGLIIVMIGGMIGFA